MYDSNNTAMHMVVLLICLYDIISIYYTIELLRLPCEMTKVSMKICSAHSMLTVAFAGEMDIIIYTIQ